MTELEQFQDAIAKQGSIRGAASALGVEEAKIRRALKAPAAPEPKEDFSALRSFGTVRQLEILDAIEQYGSQRGAAKALGIGSGTVGDSMAALKRRAARQGHSPEHMMTHPAPEGFFVKGVSSYVNKDGELTGQWIKTSIDHLKQEEFARAAAAAMAESLPRLEPIKAPERTIESLCNLYTFTDFHLGAYADSQETKSGDWNMGIAERVMTSALGHMIDAAPAAGTAFVNFGGDTLHSDGSALEPKTPLHGHILDQDGRYSRIVAVAIRLLRRMIDFALARHNKVVVLFMEGNHDLQSSIWVRALLRAVYENEPRVEVIDSELPYYVYQHGSTMLGFHHGHLSRNDSLPLLFAAQFPKIWGDTERRYVHCGHRHHVHEKEHNGVTVVQHPTLAARDAYAARGGYVSGRAARSITYHTGFGEVSRNTVTPEMFEAV